VLRPVNDWNHPECSFFFERRGFIPSKRFQVYKKQQIQEKGTSFPTEFVTSSETNICTNKGLRIETMESYFYKQSVSKSCGIGMDLKILDPPPQKHLNVAP
jgi:hypothetical protein